MRYNAENRKRKAQCTKRKIYESANELFSTHDYNDVSVDAIVEQAGVSKGSFYVHYSSKDVLITSIIKDQVTKLDTDYRRFLDSFPEDTPTQELFLSLIGKIADVLIELGCDKMQALYKAQITKEFDTNTVSSYNREIYKIFSNVLERGIARGELSANMPLDVLTKHYMMAIRGVTYEWCIRYPHYDYKTEAMQHFKFLLEGLAR